MVKYIQDLMTLPHGEIAASSAMTLAQRQWGGDTPLARAALLRWGALNLAFQDKRLETWTVTRDRDRIQVPAALVAAAGVAPLGPRQRAGGVRHPRVTRCHPGVPTTRGPGVGLYEHRGALRRLHTGFGMLRTIALYKLLKVLLLLAAAYGELLAARCLALGEAGHLGAGQTRRHGARDCESRACSEFTSGLSESKIHALRFVTLDVCRDVSRWKASACGCASAGPNG